MDRRDFLRGSMGAAILAARPADSFAQSGDPPRTVLGRWTSSASSAHRQRHQDSDQGLVHEAANGSADTARWHFDVPRQHERHRRLVLAIRRHRSSTWTTVFSLVDRRRSQKPVRALGPLYFSRSGRRGQIASVFSSLLAPAARTAPTIHHGHADDREPADGDPESGDAPRTDLPASSHGRQRRSRLLGFALTANSAGAPG